MAEQETDSKSEVVNIINIENATSTKENQKSAAVGTEGTSNTKKENGKIEDDQGHEVQDPQPSLEHDERPAESAVAETLQEGARNETQEGAGNETQEAGTGSDAKSPDTGDQGTEAKPVAHSVLDETPSEDYYEFNRSDVAYENSRIMVIVRAKPSKPADDAALDSVGVANGVGGRQEDAIEEVAPDMEHFRQLFREGKLCDLRMKSGDAVFELHRVVLTAQSRKYLEQFKRENAAGSGAVSEVTLNDVAPSAVQTVIDYLYSGVLALSEETVDGVVNCAIQLDLQALVKECVKYLSNFNVDTVLGHLQVTVQHGLTGMVDASAMIRLCVENFVALAETVGFRALTHKTLSLLLLHEEMHRVGEDLLLKATCRWLDRDPSNRTPLVVSLLEKIRLEEASPVLIEQLIEENSALGALPEVKKMLFNAYKFHALHPSGMSDCKATAEVSNLYDVHPLSSE